MSGVAVQALSHVVRRGLDQFPANDGGRFNTMALPEDADFEISTFTVLACAAIGIMTLFLIASVDYTVGSVMASLAMIESPSTTTIVESAPPAYNDEPDAPLEKKGLLGERDVEVVVINHQPITARVVTTIKHLHAVGGFFGRWRGFFQNVIYHVAVNVSGHIFGGLFSIAVGHFLGQVLGYTFSVVAMCRLHMLWTHAMISMPSTERWYKRFASRKQCKPLLLPSLVFSLAQQAALLTPAGTTILAMNIVQANTQGFKAGDVWATAMVVMSMLAVPVATLAVVICVLLPATAALTRVEACLLPEGQETIVPFDREEIIADIDVTQRCGAKRLFRSAWKSFNRSARLRLVKLYAKLMAFQFAVLLVGLHLIGAVLFFTSRDQIINAVNTMVL